MTTAQKNKRSAGGIAIACILMFIFAFVLRSMYYCMANMLGINGHATQTHGTQVVQYDRNVIVEFTTTTARENPFIFYAGANEVTVHPGQTTRAYFYVQNPTDQDHSFLSVASAAPGPLSRYLARVEDFSAKKITVPAGKTVKLSVDFFVDTQVPDWGKLLTLNYTLFPSTDRGTLARGTPPVNI